MLVRRGLGAGITSPVGPIRSGQEAANRKTSLDNELL